MVHFSNGMPTDSLVYGRRQRQYYPKMNRCVGGYQPQPTSSNTYNISYNFGPPKGVYIANTVLGGIGMLGQLFLGFMGLKQKPAQQASPFSQLNQQTPNTQMPDLLKQQQSQIDALKKQIEEMNSKQGISTPTVSTPTVSTPEESTPTVSTPEESTPETSAPTTQTPQGTQSNKSGGGSPAGWYRAANDKSTNVQASKGTQNGQTAQQILSNVLGTKLTGVLNKQQQAELLGELIKKNPSVFDGNGNPKDNADYSKLDVPTMDYIMNKFGLQKGQKTVRQDDQYAGKKLYECKNHDYMKKTKDGKVAYFKADGTQMSEAEFKKAHPTVNTQQAIKQHFN